MNRPIVYLAIALALSSLILIPVSMGLRTSSATISSSGTIRSLNLNKAAIIWNRLPRLSEYPLIAKFDLIGTEFDIPASSIQQMKALNPNLKVIGYKDLVLMRETYDDWATVNAHEDWFIHDKTTGERVRYGTTSPMHPILPYAMDPGNTEWRTYFLNYVKAKIASGNYDGVFLDDVWIACYFQNVTPDTIRTDWYNNILDFIKYIKANIGSGKITMINSNEYHTPDSTYANAVDTGMIEGFVRKYAGDISTDLIMQQIDKLYLDSTNGIQVWVLPYGNPNLIQTEIDRHIKYCFTGYLLGVNGPNALFSYYLGTDGAIDNWYFPIMDVYVGQPVAAYYQSQNVYMRDFTSGKVLFNPSSNSYNIILGQNYYFVNGTIVSNIVVGPWSGEILLSQ